jgi:protein-S-isoprenylcysteine O-methyltransferase Ste14
MEPLSREETWLTLRKTLLFLVTLALMLFLLAWTLNYWQGWLYWIVFSAITVGASLYFIKYDPALVRRRSRVGAQAEQEPTQKQIIGFTSVAMIATLVVAPLDYRFHGSNVPGAASIVALVVMVTGYALALATMVTNSYAAATITVEPNQPVVSSGVYGLVRHPMYSGAVLMFLATPVALGSWWGLIPAALTSVGIIARLLDEERVLAAKLPGYAGYCQQVRARLIPGVW